MKKLRPNWKVSCWKLHTQSEKFKLELVLNLHPMVFLRTILSTGDTRLTAVSRLSGCFKEGITERYGKAHRSVHIGCHMFKTFVIIKTMGNIFVYIFMYMPIFSHKVYFTQLYINVLNTIAQNNILNKQIRKRGLKSEREGKIKA